MRPLTKEERNKSINLLILRINQNYRDYKQDIYLGRAGFDTIHNMTLLGITGATSVTGTAATKSLLGAISTGLVGAKSNFDKNFFEDQSRDVIFMEMDALRKEVLENKIYPKMDCDLIPTAAAAVPCKKGYSMAEALMDLDAYYTAGTTLGALQAISARSIH